MSNKSGDDGEKTLLVTSDDDNNVATNQGLRFSTNNLSTVQPGPQQAQTPWTPQTNGNGLASQGQTLVDLGGGVTYTVDELLRFQTALSQLNINGGPTSYATAAASSQQQQPPVAGFNFGQSAIVKPYPSASNMTNGTERLSSSRPQEDLASLGASGWSTSTVQGRNRRVYFPSAAEDPPQRQRQNYNANNDDDDEVVQIKKGELRQLLEDAFQRGTTSTNRSPPRYENSNHHHSSRYSPSSSTPTSQVKLVQLVKNPSELHVLGKFSKLEKNNDAFKIISSYVANSHDIPERHGSVKVHEIYAFQTQSGRQTPSKSQKKGQAPHKMLLFWKTTPKGIKKLSEQNDHCVAFYDRIARAFAIQPKELTRPLRQIILVCSVSLGKKHNSKHGYGHWVKAGMAPSSDSVKGQGKLTPIWEGNKEIEDGVIVPCGRTKEHGKYPSYELNYSEYIVWEVRRVKVRFAVDVEVEMNAEGRRRGSIGGAGRGGNGGGDDGGSGGGNSSERLMARIFGGGWGGGSGGGGESNGANGSGGGGARGGAGKGDYFPSGKKSD